MHTAIVKFNPLPDTDRPGAEHQHLLAPDRAHGLVLAAIDRIIIWRLGREFRRAGRRQVIGGIVVGAVLCPADMHTLPGFLHTQGNPLLADFILRDFQNLA